MFLYSLVSGVYAQSKPETYAGQIRQHREEYKAGFLKSPNSPLKTETDVSYLRFYEPDSTYRFEADVRLTPEAEPFDMPTYEGLHKPYVQYAVLTFTHKGKPYQLALFRSLQLMRTPQYRDYLFLPFKDITNGEETYGGGRYLDFKLGDIKNGRLTLDFNKAYNPYCAFSDGYACPVPPRENRLPIAITVGEKNYGKPH
ncbi:DUF1684 domain-containing protein [Nibrella saemangeumensis]|uniref:DUF1684 domain-containing protein n=1 Tax=Nibrella saemangeumensis TaxID=1084526 RepID=A0ABP8MNJ2_9BACT